MRVARWPAQWQPGSIGGCSPRPPPAEGPAGMLIAVAIGGILPIWPVGCVLTRLSGDARAAPSRRAAPRGALGWPGGCARLPGALGVEFLVGSGDQYLGPVQRQHVREDA